MKRMHYDHVTVLLRRSTSFFTTFQSSYHPTSPVRYKTRISIVAVLLFSIFITSIAYAQRDTLRTFSGGLLLTELGLTSQLLTGPGGSIIAAGHGVPSNPDPFSPFHNPAGMQYVHQGVIVGVTVHPTIAVDLDFFPHSFQGDVNHVVDGLTSDYKQTSSYSRPKVDGSIGHAGSGFSAFSVVIPVGRMRLGFGWETPLLAELDLIQNRSRVAISSMEADGSIANANLLMRSTTQMEFTSEKMLAAVSSRMTERFMIGAAFARTRLSFTARTVGCIEGSIENLGQTFLFGDPSAISYPNNNPEMNLSGAYEGQMFTFSFGGILGGRDEADWRIGAEVVYNYVETLTGSADVQVNELAILQLQPASGQTPLDLSRASDPLQPTATISNKYRISRQLNFHVPSYLSVSFGSGDGVRPSFSISYYFADTFSWDILVQEKRGHQSGSEYVQKYYGRGIKPTWQVYYGINPGWFFLGVGAVSVRDVVDGYSDKNNTGRVPITEGNPFILPRLDAGISLSMNENLKYEVLLSGLPEDALRMVLVYHF